MRADRCIKCDLTTIPVISILPQQFNFLLSKYKIESSFINIVHQLSTIYDGASKKGLQTFLSPDSNLQYIPARGCDGSVYIRCVQIFKSAFSESTLTLLENGKEWVNFDVFLAIFSCIILIILAWKEHVGYDELFKLLL